MARNAQAVSNDLWFDGFDTPDGRVVVHVVGIDRQIHGGTVKYRDVALRLNLEKGDEPVNELELSRQDARELVTLMNRAASWGESYRKR